MANDPTESAAQRPGPDAAAPPSRSLHAPSRSLHEMADLLGGRVWLERRLFESLGRWSSTAGAAPVRVHLADASRRHGWHAQVWFERMPELSDFDVEARVRAPDERVVELLRLLDEVPDPVELSATVRLDGYHRVLLPAMLSAYRATLDRLGVAADASVARWSRLVLADDVDERERGDAVLRHLVLGDAELEAVAASRRRLEAVLGGSDLLPT